MKVTTDEFVFVQRVRRFLRGFLTVLA